MQLDAAGQIATLTVDEQLLADCGATYDADGLINLPLTVKGIQAVIFFKKIGQKTGASACDYERQHRRQRGRQTVRRRRSQNASGCSATGSLDSLKALFSEESAGASRTGG